MPSALPAELQKYSFPGVMHYLQSEWRTFERERNEWEVEKSDLKSRLAFLEGERKAMDNLKQDLVRRIKMLEYSLRQERLKKSESDDQQTVQQTPLIGPPSITQEIGSNFVKGFGHSRSRELLKSYLKEADLLLSSTQQINTKNIASLTASYSFTSQDLPKTSTPEQLDQTVLSL